LSTQAFGYQSASGGLNLFCVNLGEQFGGDQVQAYPLDRVIVLPGNTPHFRWAKSGGMSPG
jgi:hypothetical protein